LGKRSSGKSVHDLGNILENSGSIIATDAILVPVPSSESTSSHKSDLNIDSGDAVIQAPSSASISSPKAVTKKATVGDAGPSSRNKDIDDTNKDIKMSSVSLAVPPSKSHEIADTVGGRSTSSSLIKSVVAKPYRQVEASSKEGSLQRKSEALTDSSPGKLKGFSTITLKSIAAPPSSLISESTELKETSEASKPCMGSALKMNNDFVEKSALAIPQDEGKFLQTNVETVPVPQPQSQLELNSEGVVTDIKLVESSQTEKKLQAAPTIKVIPKENKAVHETENRQETCSSLTKGKEATANQNNSQLLTRLFKNPLRTAPKPSAPVQIAPPRLNALETPALAALNFVLHRYPVEEDCPDSVHQWIARIIQGETLIATEKERTKDSIGLT